MNIWVLVKSVPSVDSVLVTDEATGEVVPADGNREMDRYGAHALETALCLAEADESVQVTALSLGPDRAEAVLRRALAMGAHHGVWVRHAPGAAPDSAAVADALGRILADRPVDLVLAGVMAADTMAGAVGPMVAARLSWPWVTSVVEVKPDGDGKVLVSREVEGGGRDVYRAACPCVLTIQSTDRRPRYPALSGMLAANRYDLEIVQAGPQALSGLCSPAGPATAYVPAKKARMLEGSMEDKAEALAELLRERGLA